MTKLTKVEFDSVLSEDISVKQHKVLLSNITERFIYIVNKIDKLTEREMEWLDYDNEEGENHLGSFDPHLYDKEISYVGDFSVLTKNRMTTYDRRFPTSWLYNDFEDQLKNEVEQHKQAISDSQQKTFNRSNEIRKIANTIEDVQAQILAKLTPEEKLYIQFKNPTQVYDSTQQVNAVASRKNKMK